MEGSGLLESSEGRWQFAGVEFDSRSGEVCVDGNQVPLERKPREMLRAFLAHPGELITKSELLEMVWPGRIVSESAVTNCIGKLRTAINDPNGLVIHTVHGYGYRLIATVQINPYEHTASDNNIAKSLTIPGWDLRDRLGGSVHGEVWRAYKPESGVVSIFKIARSGFGLDILRRELAVERYLRDRVSRNVPIPTVISSQLSESPFYIQFEQAAGSPLSDWAVAAGRTREQLVELLAQTAETISIVNSVGVLHRGLNPTRFMVHASNGTAIKVALSDIGSSYLYEVDKQYPTSATLDDGEVLKAGVYLAPELLSGAAHSIKTDVYALGIILYQALIHDFKKSMAPGWEQQVGDELLCEDIAAATHIDPAQRLGDAGELARRLRDLDARRQKRAEADARLLRLRRSELALQITRARRVPLIGLFVALALGFGVSLWLALHWHNAVQQEMKDLAVTHAVTSFLTQDLLAPASAEPGHSADVTIGTLLDRAAATLDKRFAHQPLLHATLQGVLGEDYAALVEPDKAVPLLLAAEKALSELRGPADSQTESMRTALHVLYINGTITSHLDDIIAVTTRQIDAEAAAGHPHPDAEYKARVALYATQCWKNAGILHGANCGNVLDDLLKSARERFGEHDPLTLRIRYNRASLLGVSGRVDEAIPEFKSALSELQKIYGPDSPKLSLLLEQMSKGLEYGGTPSLTIPMLDHAIKQISTNLGKNHPYLWTARRALGAAYLRAGRVNDALKIQMQQLSFVIARYGKNSSQYLTALRFLVAAEVPAGKLKDAIAHANEGLTLNLHLNTDQYDAYELRNLLATVYEKQGKEHQAGELLKQNLEMAEKNAPGGDLQIGSYALHYAQHLLDQGDLDQAHLLATKALAHFRKLFGADSPLIQAAQKIETQSQIKPLSAKEPIAELRAALA